MVWSPDAKYLQIDITHGLGRSTRLHRRTRPATPGLRERRNPARPTAEPARETHRPMDIP